MNVLDPVEFTVRIIGGLTGEEYAGKFKVRKVLSLGQQIEADRIRREILGGSMPDASSVRAQNVATIFGELMLRIVDAPSWWKDNGNGLSLIDDNVVGEVYQAAMKVEESHLKSLKEKAEMAKKELQAVSPITG